MKMPSAADLERAMSLWIEVRRRTAGVCDDLRERGEGAPQYLATLASDRVPELAAHAERVAERARAVARALGVPATEVAYVEAAGRFHDVGKVVMPRTLLHKAAPLTTAERVIMRQHVDVGAELLQSVASLAALGPIVLATHEWFCGDGYPHRLAGADIPLASRIVAVCDAFDAMTEERRYQPRMPLAHALVELQRCAGRQFDPAVVAEFVALHARN